MAAIAGADGAATTSVDWARKYPPLLTIGIAAAIALIVLPSSLNLPQSNPTETLEYAPVPPDDESDDQQTGNLASLGLGSSAGIGASNRGGPGGDGPGEGEGEGESGRQRRRAAPPPPPTEFQPISPNFRCVGSPPRQTFDPLSPPCVPFFEGDNGCDTYGIGVTCDEVRLLFYIDGGITYINGSETSNQVAPGGTLYDLARTPQQNQKANNRPESQPEHLTVQALRVWQQYFNERFQTYGRYVHFYVMFSGGATPERRREDAAKALKEVGPFVVVSVASEGNEDAFLEGMARKGVLNFGAFAVREAQFFDQFPAMIWSYLPSAEQQIDTYGSYLCRQVVGRPPSLASPDLQAQAQVTYGNKRKLGLLSTTDDDFRGLQRMAALVEDRVTACGGTIEQRATFGACCLAQDPSATSEGQTQMARFKQAGITTIIWPGGISGNFVKAASSMGYYPEWIVLGDSTMDGKHPNRLAQSSGGFDGRAILITPQPFQPAMEQQLCFRAFREVNQSTSMADLQYTCNYYRDLTQVFIGIQVAGPYLGPSSMDKGFHAIPQRFFGDPVVPACFYRPGDYTCVKDAAAYVWDAAQRAPGDDQPGCWAGIEGAKRYAPDTWPEENVNARIAGNESCTGYDSRVRFNLA